MIHKDIIYGDITDPRINPRDIIIGMNTLLGEPSAIGYPYVKNVAVIRELELGSVLTYNIDEKRRLHMLICHSLGPGGWRESYNYVRYGLDYLDHQHGGRQYSIVQIGNGPVGQRDGADVEVIRMAMMDSFLRVQLFILPPEALEARVALNVPPLIPFMVWDMGRGEREIPLSVATH